MVPAAGAPAGHGAPVFPRAHGRWWRPPHPVRPGAAAFVLAHAQPDVGSAPRHGNTNFDHSLEHLAETDEAVDVDLDLFSEWQVVAVDELTLAGTALRSDADAERWDWQPGPRAPRLPLHHAGPIVTLEPHDIRTFRLAVQP